MPESTIAIVAAGAEVYFCTPVTNGHFSLTDEADERRTRESAVIAVTCLSAATVRTCAPVDSHAVDRAEGSSGLHGEAENAGDRVRAWFSPLPWTITENVSAGETGRM
ncbi:MAG: hypothetical protein H0W90_01840 [Actinobacteria bacterium]|nr:hypothetical protein [Actinomycetota bacterium]